MKTVSLQQLFPRMSVQVLSSLPKSIIVSSAVHATALAALIAWPSTETERFESTGAREVISISVTLPSQPSDESASFDIEIETTEIEIEDAKRLIDLEPIKTDLLQQQPSKQATVPSTMEIASSLKSKFRLERKIAPELRVEPLHEPDVVPQPRKKAELAVAAPSVTAQVPMEQIVGLSDEKAIFTKSDPPIYPANSVARREEGVVILRISIDVTGKVDRVELMQSSGYAALDQAAIGAVSKWQGHPAKRFGMAVESVEVLPISFRL